MTSALAQSLTSGSNGLSARAIPVVGEPFAAEFAGFDSQQNLKWRVGNKLRVMPLRELVRWGSWRDVEAGPQVLLARGGTLRADVLNLTADRLVIGDAADLGTILWDESSLPLESVAAILWQPPVEALARDRLRAKLLALPSGQDQVLLLGGESIQGTLLEVPRAGRFAEEASAKDNAAAEFAGDLFVLQTPGAEQPLRIAAAKVLAVRFGIARVQSSQGMEQSFVLGWRDGSSALADKVQIRGDSFRVQLAGGGELIANNAYGDGDREWFWRQVSLVQPGGDRVTYLSDVAPLGYKQIPFLSGEWNYGRDQNVLGGQLRTGNEVVLKGLGMFPASRLAYTLDGKYRSLHGRLALDASAGREGSVIFRVLVEDNQGMWKPAYESPVIRGGEEPVEMSVDVRQGQRLALVVEFADRGDARDYANWLDLHLLP